MGKVYTVYNNKTDELVILDGTREECAKAMGIKDDTFRNALWNYKNGYKHKWVILESEEELSPNSTFGDRIKYHRIKQNISLRDLCRKTGISYHSIFRYESNIADPPLSYAVRIAEVLGLSLDYLVKGG